MSQKLICARQDFFFLLVLNVVLCGMTTLPAIAGDLPGNSVNSPTGQPCNLAMKVQGQFIDFLAQQQFARTNPACIEFAIEQLGMLRASAAAPILVEFLDFPTPMSVEQEFTRMIVSSNPLWSRYKSKLFLISANPRCPP